MKSILNFHYTILMESPMKGLIPILIFGCLISACRNDQSRQALGRLVVADADTTFYPLLIDSGTKIVYQFGHLTADKGLKLYFDTIPNPEGGIKPAESMRKRLSCILPSSAGKIGSGSSNE